MGRGKRGGSQYTNGRGEREKANTDIGEGKTKKKKWWRNRRGRMGEGMGAIISVCGTRETRVASGDSATECQWLLLLLSDPPDLLYAQLGCLSSDGPVLCLARARGIGQNVDTQTRIGKIVQA